MARTNYKFSKGMAQITCYKCGECAVRTSPFQKYCSNCRLIERRKYKNEYERIRLKNPLIASKYRLWTREWRSKNRVKVNKRARDRNKELKDCVFAHYGNICECCGEHVRAFLTIDHVNNDGGLHRRNGTHLPGASLYRWIIKNHFPTDLRLLCYNCNCARKNTPNNICPHKMQTASGHATDF